MSQPTSLVSSLVCAGARYFSAAGVIRANQSCLSAAFHSNKLMDSVYNLKIRNESSYSQDGIMISPRTSGHLLCTSVKNVYYLTFKHH